MPLTDEEADNLGTGIAFISNWSFEIVGGSIETVDGIDLLGRDLAFAMQGDLDVVRGEQFGPNAEEEVRIVATRILDREGRVSSYDINSITQDDRMIAVSLTLTANTGERGEAILTL